MGHSSNGRGEGLFSLLPILPSERIWGFLDYTLVNIGLAIATWCFLIGGTLSVFVDLKMGFAATLAGNTISILIMALATTLPASKYGVDQYVSLRSVFGVNGTKIPMILILFIELGWAAVLSIMFGKASSNVYGALTNQPSVSNLVVILFAILAVVISWIIVAKGPVSINWLNRIVVPGLIIMLAYMFIMIWREISFEEMLALQPTSPFEERWVNYMIAFELGLGSGFSWWPIMGGLTRITKSQRAAFWPNMIGINLCAVLGTMVGLLAGLYFGSHDPTEWMIPLGGPVLGLIALLFVAFANLTSITALAYSTTLALKQIKGFMNVKWERLSFYFFFPVIPLVFFPDQVYTHFGTFLAICGTFLGPLTGIGFVDYFILRKQRIELVSLYREQPDSPYYFYGGYNYAAVIALIVATAVYFLLFNPVTFDSGNLFLYLSASLPATIVAGLVYYLLTLAFVIPKGVGGYKGIN